MYYLTTHNTKKVHRSIKRLGGSLLLLFMSCTTGLFAQNPNSPDNFIIVGKADPVGKIVFPLVSTESSYNFVIHWEYVDNTAINGVTPTITSGANSYEITGLTSGGSYRLEISGTFPVFRANSWAQIHLTEVSQWGANINWTSFNSAFNGCASLELTATDVPNLSAVTDLANMFHNCYSMTGKDANWNWNTSTITNMEAMFYIATEANPNISSWDVSNVTNTKNMLATTKFNRDLSSWNVSNIQDAERMFWGSYMNQDLGAWKLTSLTANGAKRMLFGSAKMDCVNTSKTLIGWAATISEQAANLNFDHLPNDSMYFSSDAAAAVASLKAHGWTFHPEPSKEVNVGVNPTVESAGVISPAFATICLGGSTTFSSTVPGGIWILDTGFGGTLDPNSGSYVANPADVFFQAQTRLIYTIGNACAAQAHHSFYIEPIEAVVTPLSACMSASPITFTSASPGGTWLVPDWVDWPAGTSFDPATGTLTVTEPPGSCGNYMIRYIAPADQNGCTAVKQHMFEIFAPYNMGTIGVTNSDTLCVGDLEQLTYTGADPIPGWCINQSIPWSSSDATVATVDQSTGEVTAVNAGNVRIYYRVMGDPMVPIGDCFDTLRWIDLVVLPASAGTLSGLDTLSAGLSTTLTSSAGTGGTWSSSDATIASVDPLTGVVTGVGEGDAVITYSVSNQCGTDAATHNIHIKTCTPLPNAGTEITGPATLGVGNTTTYSTGGDANGTWSSSNLSALTIDASTGVATGINAGTSIVSYTVTNDCGVDVLTKSVEVTATGGGGTPPPPGGGNSGVEDIDAISEVSLFPNPANESVHVQFNLSGASQVQLVLVDMTGTIHANVSINGQIGTNTTELNLSDYAQGMYTILIRSNDALTSKKLIKQ